jgi:signal transduction histidine kinase
VDATETKETSGLWPAPSTLRLLARIAETSRLPTALVEGDEHRIRFTNRAFSGLLGRSTEALQGVPFAALTRDVSLSPLLREASRNETGQLRQDVAYTRPDGSIVYGTTFLTDIPGPAGMLLVQVIDATEQLLLREQTAQTMRDTVQANERLVLAALREHELTEEANQRAAQITRMLEEKTQLASASASLAASLDLHVTLRRAAEVCAPDFADGVVVTFTRGKAVETATWWQPDARLVPLFQRAAQAMSAEKGSVLPDLAGLSLIQVNLSVRGEELGRILFMRDAATWRFDEADGEWAGDLAARVSMALDNAWLHEAARQAIRTRDDVLSMVSHDLRNPLSSLMLTVQQLLFGDPLDASSPLFRKTLEVMHRSTEHMKRMVEELLELAGLQACHFVLEFSAKTSGALLEEVLEMVEPQARQKGLQVRTQIETPSQEISCDPERIVRALGNLLTNAIKFSRPGSAITLSCQVAEAAGARGEGQLCIAVSDAGVGIPAADLEHLFEPYWKGPGTGRTGTGLGLYIARGIIQAHGGTLTVESTLGSGSTFTCRLPLRRHVAR